MKKTILNILSYTREIVITCTFFSILYIRSLHIIYFTLCAILCTSEAKILKRVIKQPRPTRHDKLRRSSTEYGMPSSHSTAISFFAVYLQCVVTQYIATTASFELVTAGLMLLLFHWFALGVMWSRVRLGHHTSGQVIAGMTLGGLSAFLSFMMWQKGGLSKTMPEFLNQQLGLGWLLDLFDIN